MTVGLLFPGEMGAAVGAAARADVLWAGEGRSQRTRRRAVEAGLEDVGSVDALVARADVVLSISPPAIAEEVAAQVARLGFRGLYVEANPVTPTRVARIGEMLAATGARIVDASIISPGAIHLYLAGAAEDVASVAALFADTDVDAIALEGGIGAASALKMAFGGWNKIGIALTAQAHAVARAYGAEAALAAEGVDARRIVSAAPKAWRWAPEMDEIALTCAELGLPDGIARGAAELYRRWEKHRDAEAELTELLDDLLEEG